MKAYTAPEVEVISLNIEEKLMEEREPSGEGGTTSVEDE